MECQRIEDTVDGINSIHEVANVVVNDSILLVNFIKHYHCGTKSVPDVTPKASQARFRAVFLASATTIVGLMPMRTETNLQA